MVMLESMHIPTTPSVLDYNLPSILSPTLTIDSTKKVQVMFRKHYTIGIGNIFQMQMQWYYFESIQPVFS